MNRGSGVLVVFLTTAACAASGPRMFRFASDLRPADGRACALGVLRRHGFGFPSVVAADSPAVAVRSPVRTSKGPGEWWRVELSVGTDSDGHTLVTSVVGASDREAGPFTAPPDPLQEVGAEITARCTWPAG